MNIYFSTIKDELEGTGLKEIISDYFNMTDTQTCGVLDTIKVHLGKLKKNIFLVIETDYVDRVYRNSYYCYYSTKLKQYSRNCIKISFFATEISLADFNTEEGIAKIKSAYVGFMVIRPTPPNVIGRNVISPRALENDKIKICSTKIHSTAYGLELDVEGFPHSSQDTETMTCAETTIWALMEYFSSKYPDYSPISPAKIVKTLESRSCDRQVPSKGLIYQDISYVLKRQGFGTLTYAKEKYGDKLKKIFSCYIESGIPLIVLIRNEKTDIYQVAHAVLCIGRTDINNDSIDRMALSKDRSIYEWNNNIDEFIFADDNKPNYQSARFDSPTIHYEPAKWKSCTISSFIVPLYNKIYLEADQAIDIANYMAEEILKINEGAVVRTFLASGKSYRNYIINSLEIPLSLRDLIVQKSLPKFVWVTEISSSLEICKQKKVNGIILMDATEVQKFDYASLIFAHYEGCFYDFSEKENKYQKRFMIPQVLHPVYKAYTSNLLTIN